MRVAITGATGNVGTSVILALETDPSISSIVGIARRRPEWQPDKVTWVQADVAGDDLVPYLKGMDAVIHLAWLIQPSRDAEALWRTNVLGSERVFAAAVKAGVPAVVHASSVGVYSPGPKTTLVDESWATDGIPTLGYSWQKAYVERVLDGFERDNPQMRFVRLRPALTFKREAASEIRRLFLGPFFPNRLAISSLTQLARHSPVRFQAVHSLDVGEAYCLAATRPVKGAFNIAADPVLGTGEGQAPLAWAARSVFGAAWRLRLEPAPAGWIDLAFRSPIMNTARARQELGWEPNRTSLQALRDLLAGFRAGASFPTPPLEAGTSGPLRVKEVLTGVGSR